MTIINILKDGTVVDDMSKVTVPKDVIEKTISIMQRKERMRSEKVHK